jgi:hypothetical protein
MAAQAESEFSTTYQESAKVVELDALLDTHSSLAKSCQNLIATIGTWQSVGDIQDLVRLYEEFDLASLCLNLEEETARTGAASQQAETDVEDISRQVSDLSTKADMLRVSIAELDEMI